MIALRKQVKRNLIVAAVVTASFFLLGWSNSLESIKQKAKDIHSIQADFVQEKHMEILVKPLISIGKFYFKSPQSLRWEYTKPIQSILVMNKDKIKRYVMSSDGMIEDDSAALQSMQVFLQEITSWIKGDFEKNPNFAAELQPEGIIVLKPKDPAMATIINKIYLKLADTTGVIESVTIYETPTTYTVIKFKNVKINKPIAASVFQAN